MARDANEIKGDILDRLRAAPRLATDAGTSQEAIDKIAELVEAVRNLNATVKQRYSLPDDPAQYIADLKQSFADLYAAAGNDPNTIANLNTLIDLAGCSNALTHEVRALIEVSYHDEDAVNFSYRRGLKRVDDKHDSLAQRITQLEATNQAQAAQITELQERSFRKACAQVWTAIPNPVKYAGGGLALLTLKSCGYL